MTNKINKKNKKESDSKNARGIFSEYANKQLLNNEKDAFKNAMISKHK